jgi:hypothetical protein
LHFLELHPNRGLTASYPQRAGSARSQSAGGVIIMEILIPCVLYAAVLLFVVSNLTEAH